MEGGHFFNSDAISTLDVVPTSPIDRDLPELNKILAELYAVNKATSAMSAHASPSSLMDGSFDGNSGVATLDSLLELNSPFSSNAPFSPPASPAFSTGDSQLSYTSKPLYVLPVKPIYSCEVTTNNAPTPNKRKKRVKPRMVDLPADVAKAKRESNRASARKCRERKRERHQLAMAQSSAVQKELQTLRSTVRVLTNLLAQRERMISALTSQHLPETPGKNTFSEGLPV